MKLIGLIVEIRVRNNLLYFFNLWLFHRCFQFLYLFRGITALIIFPVAILKTFVFFSVNFIFRGKIGFDQ